MTIEERYELSFYEKLTRLAGQKEIWLVRHRETGELFVWKEMALYNREVYRQLQEEDYPDIPQVVCCVEEPEHLILLEEYIHGNTLAQILEREGALPEARVLTLMQALCRIVTALHESTPPIVHRDIKPSNLMLSKDGVLKLIDFNAAREVREDDAQDTRLMGTQKFAAPEQYGFGQSDARTDIYAMGVTMRYLLTGELSGQQSYPGRLGEIISRCMNLEKEKRYQTAAELAEALREYAQSTDARGKMCAAEGALRQSDRAERTEAAAEAPGLDSEVSHQPDDRSRTGSVETGWRSGDDTKNEARCWLGGMGRRGVAAEGQRLDGGGKSEAGKPPDGTDQQEAAAGTPQSAGAGESAAWAQNKNNTEYAEKFGARRRSRWLPVGFRTGVFWKELLAVFGYAMIFCMCVSMTLTESDGGSMHGYRLWANRAAIFIWFLGDIAFLGNYGDIWARLPLMRGHTVIRILMMAGYLVAWLVVVLMILTMAGG